MTRHFFIFLGTFVVGAVIALAARSARFNAHEAHPPVTATVTAPAAKDHGSTDAHAAHHDAPAKTVNTVCAICGMDVDPEIAPAEYQGKLIGFGCAACPPKFKKNPDKWGPSALRNEVLEN